MALLKSNGLIDIGGDRKILPNQLGLICASSGFRVDTFRRLVDLIESGTYSPLDVALIASTAPEAGLDAVGLSMSTEEYRQRTAHFVRTLRENDALNQAPLTQAMLEGLSTVDYETARKLKFIVVALAYVSGVASREIEDRLGASAGRARMIGSNCSWLCDTLARIAWGAGREEQAKSLERLADRFHHGCSEAALLLAQVGYRMHRADRERVVNAGYTSPQKILDTPPEEIVRNSQISRGYVQGLQRAIAELLGDTLALECQQLARLRARAVSIELLEALYTAKGLLLEQAVADVLTPPFCPLNVSRITLQREGEADLRIILSSGKNGIVQVTAKDNPSDKIGLVKAGAILQQSPELNPEVFICCGRPDFDKGAIGKAKAHASAGRNYKLISISVLAEMYVRYHEGRITSDRIQEVLENKSGYITIDRL